MGAGHCCPCASREQAGNVNDGFSKRHWTALQMTYCGNARIVSKIQFERGVVCWRVLAVRVGQEEE